MGPKRVRHDLATDAGAQPATQRTAAGPQAWLWVGGCSENLGDEQKQMQGEVKGVHG